jgi:class 3 adenylate cyclase
MAEQPTGTVTLLFTDVDGSTRLLERLGPERVGPKNSIRAKSTV